MTTAVPIVRKIVALAILAAVVATPVAAGAGLVAVYQQNRQEIHDRREQLAKLRAIARYAPELDRNEAKSAETAFASWFLPDADPGMAAANLQEKLRSIAQSHGVDIMQAADIPPKTEQDVVYVGLALDMAGQAEGVHAMLGDIGRAEPLLMIGRIALRAEGSGGDPRYDRIPLYLSADIWAALPVKRSAK